MGRSITSILAVILLAAVMPSAAQAGWSDSSVISAAGLPTSDTRIAGTPDGRSFVVWKRQVLGLDTIEATLLDAQGNPGSQLTLTSEPAPAEDYQVAITPSGVATVVWSRLTGLNKVIQSVQVSASGDIGPVVTRSDAGPAGQDATVPQIAVGPTGAGFLIWRKFNGTKWIIEGRTLTANGTAGAIISLQDTADPEADPVAIAGSPMVVAQPSGTFRTVWTSGSGDTETIMTKAVTAQGVSDATPTPLLVQGEGCPEKLDTRIRTGGAPHDFQMVVDSGGIVTLGWIRSALRVTSFTFQPEDGDKPEICTIDSSVVRETAETVRFGVSGLPARILQVSSVDKDVSQLALDMAPGGATRIGWKTGGASGRLETTRTGAEGPIGVFAVLAENIDAAEGNLFVKQGAGGWSTAAWTEDSPTPGLKIVKVSRIGPGGRPGVPVDVAGATSKSSADPQVAVSDLGVPTVAFNAIDMSDLGAISIARYTDPGMAMSPESITYGGGLLNIAGGTRSAFVSNPGSTASLVTIIGISGADPSQFRAEQAQNCIRQISPGELCEIRVTFAPTSVGQKTATLDLNSEAGSDSVILRGTGVARTRLSLEAKPKSRRVKPGRVTKLKGIVKNNGGLSAGQVKICVRGSKRIVRPKKQCRKVGSVGVGQTSNNTFNVRLRKKAKRGRSYPITFRLSSDNANSRRATIKLKAK